MKLKKLLTVLIASLALTGCSGAVATEDTSAVVINVKPNGRLEPAETSTVSESTLSTSPVAIETSSVAEPTTVVVEETTTESASDIYPVSLSAVVSGNHYIGDSLTAADFTITVKMSDGSELVNPPGFAADPLILAGASNVINVAYGSLTTTVTVAATEASFLQAPPKDGDYIVVLDPGHGGIDNGSGSDDRLEKIMTLKVGLACKAYLETHYNGIIVLMTRDTDTRLETDHTGTDIKSRVLYAVNVGADALVSLHFNATGEHNVYGALGIATVDTSLRPYAESLSNCILTQLSKLGLRSKGTYTHTNDAGTDYYAINRHSTAYGKVGIIIEHCFLDHENDVPFCNSDAALQALGEADARGIAAYFGLTAK